MNDSIGEELLNTYKGRDWQKPPPMLTYRPPIYKRGYNTKSFLPYIRDWFLSKREHFTSFSIADSRIEGWFKAELLVLFNKLAKEEKKGEREGHIDLEYKERMGPYLLYYNKRQPLRERRAI